MTEKEKMQIPRLGDKRHPDPELLVKYNEIFKKRDFRALVKLTCENL